MELPQKTVDDITRFLQSNGGEAPDTSVAASAMVKTIQLIGERYPWYYYVDPRDGKSKVRHQSKGAPAGMYLSSPKIPSSDPTASQASYGPAKSSTGSSASAPYSESAKTGQPPRKKISIDEAIRMTGILSQPIEEKKPEQLTVDQFLMQHQVEEHAAATFRACVPDVQRIVINKGSMQGARDQTAVLMDRMGKATQAVTTGSVDTSSFAYAQPGDWTCPNCLDLQFARNTECRKCGTPNPNPNAAAARKTSSVQTIQKFQEEHKEETGKQTDDDKAFVETFLAASTVEQHAADMLRQMPPDLQRMVINKGSLADARDQTAVLISRMNLSTQTRGATVPDAANLGASAKQGDWVCAGCLDVQFARNTMCRKCNTPNPMMMRSNPMVDEFLLLNSIEDHAAMRFKSLDPRTQQMIMARGSLEGSRDKTAVLMSRMRQIQEGNMMVTARQEPQAGDWYCPSCKDLQFRRNTTCRRCGTPNPGDGGVRSYSTSPFVGMNPFAPRQGTIGELRNEMQAMMERVKKCK